MTDIAPTASPARSVVFIDSRVQDAATLLQGLEPGTEVVFLQAGQDGLAQMAAALGEMGDVGAVQVIAHGSAGQLWLGSRFLDNTTLQQPEVQALLAGLGRGLTADGDLLVYACNTAQGSEGAQFVSNLAALTGADVAASDDRTGAQGDWELEITTGHIAASVVLSPDDLAAYDKALTTFTVTNSADAGAGSLRKAITDANTAPGADIIEFAPGLIGSTVTLSTGQLAISSDLQIKGDIDGNGTPDITINGNAASRVLNITSGTVVVDGLTITNGKLFGADNSGVTALGAGISVTGAGTQLTLLHSSIASNTAKGGSGASGINGGSGGTAAGGLYIGPGATVQMATTSVTGNSGTGGNGGYGYNQGGNGGNGTGGVLVSGTFRYESGSVNISGNAGAGGAGGSSTMLNMGASGTSTPNISGSADNSWVYDLPPSISNLNGDSVAWAGVGNAVTLDAGRNAALADADLGALNSGNGNWAGASLTVQRIGTAVSTDVLGFNTAGASFTVSGNNLQSAGQTFATYTNSGGVLAISFTSSGTAATTALVNDVARHITYGNDTPAGDATLRFTLHDGTASTTADVTVASDTIYVTNATDTATIDSSNGVSFSEAIAIAAADITGSQTIVIAPSLTGQTLTLAGNVAVNENLTLDLSAASGVTLSGSTLTLGAGATLTVVNGAGNTATIDTALAGSGALVTVGLGDLWLTGSNGSHSGSVSVNAGAVHALGGSALGDTSAVSVQAGAMLLVGSNETIGSLAGAGSVVLNASLTTGSANTSTTFSGSIIGTGGLSKVGTGTLTLAGSNGYDGSTQIAAGTLAIASDSNLGAGQVHFTGGALAVTGATIIDNAIQVTSNSGIRALADTTLSGALTGAASLDVFGPGTFTLANAANNLNVVYLEGGSTLLVNGGLTASYINASSGTTLLVNGALTASNIHASSGSTLGGSGSIGGDVHIWDATLSPGSGAGTGVLTINGNLNLNDGSTLAAQINGNTAGTGYDQVVVNGAVSIHPNTTLAVTHGYPPAAGDVYTLIVNNAADAVVGAFNGLAEGGTRTAGGNGTVLTASYVGGTGNDITLTAPTNVPPVATTSGGAAAFTEGANVTSTPVAIDSGITLSDADNATLASATVAITGNFHSGEDLLAFSNDGSTMSNVAASYNGTTGVLTLSSAGASATLAQWQAALRAVTYTNSSENPTTADRTLSFTVNDGTSSSTAATRVVTVAAVNDAPVAVADSLTVAEGGTATTLAGGATSVLANDTDGEASTLVSVLVTGPAHGSVTLNANGTFSYVHNGSDTTTDSFSYKPNDGTADGNTVSVAITVTPVNDAPANTVPGAQVIAEDNALVFSVGNGNALAISDVDAGGSPLEVNLSVTNGTLTLAGTTGLSFTTGDGTADSTLVFSGTLADINNALAGLAYTPTANYHGAAVLSLVTSDLGNTGSGGTLTDTDTVNITVNPSNDAPTVATAIADQNATEDTAFNFQFDANAFADVDVGDTLTYSAQLSGGGALPTWLNFDPATRTFSGTPFNDHVGTLSIDVIANDGTATATDTFDLVVANTNDAPTVANAIPNQNATEDAAFNFQFAANDFADVDVGDTLTYSAQLAGGGVLPAWLSFDAATRTFSGTPLNAHVGMVSIDVIANDGKGGTVTDTFSIVVTNTNDAPMVANVIPNQNASANAAFNFQFAANTFLDVDVGDALTYSAQMNGGGALPAWLIFDAATRTFSGTPLNAHVGTLSIDVIASDGNGGTVSDSFNLVVAAPPPPPPPPPPPAPVVDGVPVVSTPGDGGTTIITIPVVQPTRPDDPSSPNTNLADIPLVTAPDGHPIVQVSVPVGVGIQAQGLATPVSGAAAVTELGLRIERMAGGNPELTNDGQTFLATLDPSEPLTVQTITATVGAGFNPNVPFVISGSTAPADGKQAVLLDARALPSGTLIQVDNIDFVAIVGAVRVIGGAGQNIASGDGSAQWIVLGADDDVIHGGGGNDVVASKGGNDRLYGDEGDDTIVGGVGDDHLEGGAGNDLLQGGMSDAGAWSFALNPDGNMHASYNASQGLLTDTHNVSAAGRWSGSDVLDARLALVHQDYTQLETISLLFQGLTGELPTLQAMNTFATQGWSRAELLHAAWTWYEGTLPAGTTPPDKMKALITQTWGPEHATAPNIQIGLDYLAQGGSWSEGLGYLVAHANVRGQITSEGHLNLTQAGQIGETGWGLDSGNDVLLGGAGNDVLIGGNGNDILDGGAGTDQAVFLGALPHFSVQLRASTASAATADQKELVLRNALSGEEDILRDVELLQIGGQAYRLQLQGLQEGAAHQPLAAHVQAMGSEEIVLVGLPAF